MLRPLGCRILPAAIAFLLFSASAVVAFRYTEAQEREAGPALPRPVMDTHDLMNLFNKPLYQQLKQKMQQEPSDEPQWKKIADRGWQAAEVANLVALREDQPQWRQLSARLQQAGVGLAEAAKAGDIQATRQAYSHLIERCNACHRTVAADHAPQLMP